MNKSYTGALHILGGGLLRHKVERYVDLEAQEIDCQGLLEASRPWSHGERLMVQVACDMYNGSGGAILSELLDTLDDENLDLVLEAVKIKRRRVIP